MDYARIYGAFIVDRSAKHSSKAKTFGMERHHIVPKCLGGSNEHANLVNLTYSDHIFAHLLLAKVYGGKLAIAFQKMTTVTRYQGQHTRLAHAALMAESRRAKGDGRRGEKGRHTPAQSVALKAYNNSRVGKPPSEAQMRHLRKLHADRVGKPASSAIVEPFARKGDARSMHQKKRDLLACAKMLNRRGLLEASARVSARAALLTSENQP